MPMNNKTTPSHEQNPKEKSAPALKGPRVSEQTLAFLRCFAGNYYVEQKLPQGLQGIILG